jgi:hypothetical protein
MFGQFGRIMSRAPAGHGRGRRGDDASQLRVLCRCGQREVPGPQRLVPGHVSQRQMKGPSLRYPRMPPGRHGKQRMCQPDPLTVRDQQPGSHQLVYGRGIGDRHELGQAQPPAQRHDEQRPAGRPRKLRHACPERVTSQISDRRFGADRPRPAFHQGPAEFQREQRIPLRCVEQAPERSWWQGQAEALRQQTARGTQAQRPDLSRVQHGRPQRFLHAGSRARPSGQQELELLPTGPAIREREHFGRGGIKPLQVIHGDQQRLAGCQRAQHAQEPRGDREALRCRVHRLGPQQRRLQCPPLRNRQAADGPDVDPLEQVEKPGERKLRLSPARPRRQHANTPVTGQPQAPFPQRRLADARPARQQQGEPGSVPVKELLQHRQLGLPADHPEASPCLTLPACPAPPYLR